jgi:polysaccharide biosynthesis transport protein
MLQRNKPAASTEGRFAPDFPSAADLLESFVHFSRQQFRVIVLTVILCAGLGIAYLAVARPSYIATAVMLIDAHKSSFLQDKPSISEAQFDTAAVESQLIVLRSDNVALSVINKLRLVDDPEFAHSNSPGWIATRYRAGISVIKNELAKHFDWKFADPPVQSEPSAEFMALRSALDTFKSRLEIKRDTLSFVIEVSFRSYDAEKAARIANAIVNSYIIDQLDAKYKSTLVASNWLDDRMRELRAQSSVAEQAVVDYRREHKLIDAAGKSASGQRVAELNSQLIITRTQAAEAHARLDRVQAVLSADSSGEIDGTVTDTLKNDVVTRLRGQYLDLSRKEIEWSAKYGSGHLAVVSLRKQMADTRAAIADELRRVAETYKSDFEIAKQRSEAAQKEYDLAVGQAEESNQAQVVLSDLESKSKTYRALYENFLQRYTDSVQQQSFPIPEAHLISPASRPLQQSSPKTLLVLAISVGAGIFFGFAIGVLRDLWDRVFRTTEQAEKILQAPCITLVPFAKILRSPPALPVDRFRLERTSTVKPAEEPQRKVTHEDSDKPLNRATRRQRRRAGRLAVGDSTAKTLQPAGEGSPRTFAHDSGPYWRSVDSPFTRFAESIRGIKVAIDLSRGASSSNVIGLTSALPNEGKSTLAAALALLIAQVGGRVILVDCDLRNPSLTRMLAPSAKAGLLDVASGNCSIEDVLWWSDPAIELPFLPAVVEPHVAHTAEILASKSLRSLFDQLQERYEYIIADLSPLAPVVDVRATAHLVNSYVCVIEWGQTKIDVVKRALAEAPGVHDNLLGTVLNKADIRKLHRYEAHRGEYYNSKHYSRYGFS